MFDSSRLIRDLCISDLTSESSLVHVQAGAISCALHDGRSLVDNGLGLDKTQALPFARLNDMNRRSANRGNGRFDTVRPFISASLVFCSVVFAGISDRTKPRNGNI